MRKFIILTLMAVAVLGGLALTSGKAEAATNSKVTICHATSSQETPWVRINVSINAIGGHFENPGTPLSGHEDDLLFPDPDNNIKCPGDEVLDLCPNIEGNQTSIEGLPGDGWYVDENGDCVQGGQGGNPETPTTPTTPVVPVSAITTMPYTGNGFVELLAVLGASAVALTATYFASVKSFKFLNK